MFFNRYIFYLINKHGAVVNEFTVPTGQRDQ